MSFIRILGFVWCWSDIGSGVYDNGGQASEEADQWKETLAIPVEKKAKW